MLCVGEGREGVKGEEKGAGRKGEGKNLIAA